MNTTHPDLSVVVPLYNEQAGIDIFHRSLTKELVALKLSYEIVYCNDGSHDNTLDLVRAIAAKDGHVNYLSFSRNFGKELATTAAIHAAKGKAVLIMDGDGQHPMQHIPEFVARWQQGKRVVVGVYTANKHRSSWFKSFAARTFYKLFNHFVGFHLTPGATDFRLIDRQVVAEFVRLKEHNRITRGLIDWLGYEQDYVYFEADPRIAGDATYGYGQLMKLAINSVVSMSVSPLYVVAYIGAIVLPLSLLLLLGMIIDALIGDPLDLHATGGAYLDVISLCLVGILMVSQGIIGLYLSHIHAESQDRPLYIISEAKAAAKA